MFQDPFLKAAQYIQNANALIITAGAGMGVDSGLPDFRGKEGFWRAYPFARKMGISFEQLANPVWFDTDPHVAWAFYGHRLMLYRQTTPHKGFDILLNIGKNKIFGYFVFTSNVDGQFQKAGFSDNQIVEVHGSIHHLQCTVPCGQDIWSADGIEVQIDLDKFKAHDPLPTCPFCGAVARPNILMFNDWKWISLRTDEQEARFHAWLSFLQENKAKPVIIEIGAGTAVPTVRLTSEQLARQFDAPLIRINPYESQIPYDIKGVSLAYSALEALTKIQKSLNN